MVGAVVAQDGRRHASPAIRRRHPQAAHVRPTPAGEAAGSGAFVSCYNFGRLPNQAFQVLRKRTKQTLRVRVVSEELDDVAALECCH
jgi:hypothetical protein